MGLMSMTGFGRARGEISSRFGASVVIRSVNHRYLDTQIRTNLREEVPEIEAVVRSAITERFQRGRVTAQLNFERIGSAAVDVAVNVEAVRQVIDQLALLELPATVAGPVQLGDVLGVPGLVAVTSPETILSDDEKKALRSVTVEAVEAVAAMRGSEGERLERQIVAELADVAGFVDWLEPQMPDIRRNILERTRERISDLVGSSVAVDEDRLVQEAARKEGIPLETGPIMAFTDAMAFAMKGIRATSLVALNEKGMVDTYHSVEDRPQHLDYDLLFDSYRLCIAFLDHIDARP